MGSSQVQWQAVFEALPHPAFVLDTDSRILAANRAAISAVGLRRDQVIGRPCWEVCHGTAEPPDGCPFQRLKASGKPQISQMEVEVLGGIYLVSCMPIIDHQGQVGGILHVAADITPIKQVEGLLRQQQALLQGIYLAVPVGIGLVHNRILKDCNQRLCQMIGYDRQQIMGRDSRFLYLTDQEYDRVGRNYDNIRRDGIGTIESQWRCKDGRVIDVFLHYAALNPKDLSEGVVFAALDITERKRSEQQIRGLNRLYATLSNINQTIVRVRDEQLLYDSICRVVVEEGQFRMAWIGLVEQDTGLVRPIASWGEGRDYLSQIQISIKEQPEGRGPTGTAIRQNRICICQDIESDPRMEPWRHAALERGFRSSAAVPIQLSGRVIGALNLYAAEPGFFSDNETRLLHEMGRDISFALEMIHSDRQRAQMEQALQLSEQRFQIATMGANEGLWDWPDLDKDQQWWSPVFFKLLGYKEGQIEPSYSAFCQLVHPKQRDAFKSACVMLIKRDMPLDVVCRMRTSSGRYRWFAIRAGSIKDKDGNVIRIAGSIRDVTDIRRAQQRLAANQRRLNSLATQLSLAQERERRRIAVGVHDDIGQRLALAKLQLQTLLHSQTANQVAGVVEQVCELIEQTMQQARSLAFELSCPVLYEVGLDAAIESWLTRQIEQRTGIKCHFSSEVVELRLEEELAVVLFQAVKELLTNIVKHAKARNIRVHMARLHNQLKITISDDGIGFDVGSVKTTGFGLFNVRERLGSVKGQLVIDSAPGQGTTATIAVPMRLATRA